MFEAGGKTLRSRRNKILYAQSKMDNACKQMFTTECSFATPERRRLLKKDWPTFKDWTRGHIRQSANLLATQIARLEKTKQLSGQDPREFDQYLSNLEQQFSAQKTTEERAVLYFGKLLDSLQLDMVRYQEKLPVTRGDMVDLAARRWEYLSKAERGTPKS